jgi:RNA polymerase sigma-70 factor (ECF subfamily)
MMDALEKWNYLRGIERPDSWLFKVATRKLHRLQARARKRDILNEDRASSAIDLRIAAVTDVWVETHVDLIAAMRSLPRRQCEVILLHFFGGYTLNETAQILDVAESTVKTHLDRGLKALRQHEGVPTPPKTPRRVPV